MPHSLVDRLIAMILDAGRCSVLLVVAGMVGIIAIADSRVGLDISLGILYIVPVILAAIVIQPWYVLFLALLVTILRGLFDNPHSFLEEALRFGFAFIAYTAAGLFVTAIMRSRKEQSRRMQAEEALETLVESSPAGILTLNEDGVVVAANRAANDMFALERGQTMKSRKIDSYLPVLSDVLRVRAEVLPFRTSAQSQGRRDNGELFLADCWLSTYPTPAGRRLAAIIIDSSEEMREREERGLRRLSMSSRIMAGAMLHEVRNLCGAISTVYADIARSVELAGGEKAEALENLVQGLKRIAASELEAPEPEPPELVSLKDVLNELRIILEPSWLEIEGTLRWDLPPDVPLVFADRQGLLQVFLNLAQNSQRAVVESPVRELAVSVFRSKERVFIRFADSGCGVAEPHRLFQPFQPGAHSSGLGLYISRSLLRSYGGELHFEPQKDGAAFVVGLEGSFQ